MKEFIEKLIGRLEEYPHGKYEDEYGKGFSAGINASIEEVNELAEEYMVCYKSCTECEAYDKGKHHCPKFCYIIAETVKEIEEEHKELIELSRRYLIDTNELLEYQAIGTVEQLKAIKQWKSDVMEGFCKYDASSFEEIVVNARAKAIDEFAENLKKIIEKDLANPDLMLDCKKCGIWKAKDIDEIAEQMKGGGNDVETN